MLMPAFSATTNRRSVVLFALLFAFTLFLVVGIHNTVRFGSQRSTDREQD
jgi:YbbR domain-containing protein